MGFFGGDNEDSGPSQADLLMDQQIRQNQAELEARRKSLYQTQLGILKGQGAENWTSEKPETK